jgi:hypothetical protein
MRLTIVTICLLLFFQGCETKKKIFSHTYQKLDTKISTINLINDNPIIQKAFQNSDFKLDKNANFTIKADYSLYPKQCNNPLATAEDKSYIGFMRFTLSQYDKKVYMCQIDFKSEPDVGLVKYLINYLKDNTGQ